MRRRFLNAFTLIELAVTVAVIIVLAGLILVASGFILTKAKRSRAEVEIAAISTALENYRVDNGAYPSNNETSSLNPATINPIAYRSASLVPLFSNHRRRRRQPTDSCAFQRQELFWDRVETEHARAEPARSWDLPARSVWKQLRLLNRQSREPKWIHWTQSNLRFVEHCELHGPSALDQELVDAATDRGSA